MKGLNHIVISGIVFLMIHTMWCPAVTGSNGRSQNAVIQVKNGMLTASVKEISLIDILDKLADQTGMGFELYAEVDRKISANYYEIPLDQGLRRLLSSSNYIIVYTDKNSPSKKPYIKKIIVYDKSGSRGGQRIKQQASRSIVRENDTKTDKEKSLEEYANQLNDDDPDIREEAISDMVDEYEEAALVYLEKALVHDGNDDVRAAAAEEIGELESEEGIAILAKGLYDPDEDVRETVVEALGEIGGKSTLSLLQIALKDENEDIRETATDLIEEIEEDEKEAE